jgi:SAM-dependent methyltransferase
MDQPADPLWHGVRAFWSARACGETYAVGGSLREQLDRQAAARYGLEPYIPRFAACERGRGRDVLEIGVGMGADHLLWAEARPRRLVGIDVTERAVGFTGARLALHGHPPRLAVADAQALPFPDGSFDLVYSWGVLHHVPSPRAAVAEVRRVLRNGGEARVMLYHRRSYVGLMLWLRYGALALRPWRGLRPLFNTRFESPGTQAFTPVEATELFEGFSRIAVRPALSFVDLLQGSVGQQHEGTALRLARKWWPRWLVARLGSRFGFYLLVEAER